MSSPFGSYESSRLKSWNPVLLLSQNRNFNHFDAKTAKMNSKTKKYGDCFGRFFHSANIITESSRIYPFAFWTSVAKIRPSLMTESKVRMQFFIKNSRI